MNHSRYIFVLTLIIAQTFLHSISFALERCPADSNEKKIGKAIQCETCSEKSLLITNQTILHTESTQQPARIEWTFGYLINEMAGDPNNPEDKNRHPIKFLNNWLLSLVEKQEFEKKKFKMNLRDCLSGLLTNPNQCTDKLNDCLKQGNLTNPAIPPEQEKLKECIKKEYIFERGYDHVKEIDYGVSQENSQLKKALNNWIEKLKEYDESLNEDAIKFMNRTAPLRLVAIIYRPDLAKYNYKNNEIRNVRSAGEGRFLFRLIDKIGDNPTNNPINFNIIFEYHLVAENTIDKNGIEIRGERFLREWAENWYDLSTMPVENSECSNDIDDSDSNYCSKLAMITKSFTDRNPEPYVTYFPEFFNSSSRPTNVALDQTRISYEDESRWAFREFKINHKGQLEHQLVANTPHNPPSDESFDPSVILIEKKKKVKELIADQLLDIKSKNVISVVIDDSGQINDCEQPENNNCIKLQIANGEKFRIPDKYLDFEVVNLHSMRGWFQKKIGGIDQLSPTFPGFDTDVRLWFSINTCDGCHGHDAAETKFIHIDATDKETNQKILSDFLCNYDLPLRLIKLSELREADSVVESAGIEIIDERKIGKRYLMDITKWSEIRPH